MVRSKVRHDVTHMHRIEAATAFKFMLDTGPDMDRSERKKSRGEAVFNKER